MSLPGGGMCQSVIVTFLGHIHLLFGAICMMTKQYACGTKTICMIISVNLSFLDILMNGISCIF